MKSRYFTLLALIPPAAGEGRPSRRLEGPHFSARTLIPNPRPSPANPLECALTQTQLRNPIRINTYRTQPNDRKTRSFKPCPCNTYAPQPCNPFRCNTCIKHRGGGTACGKLLRRNGSGSRPPDLLTSLPLPLSLCETPAFARPACRQAGDAHEAS